MSYVLFVSPIGEDYTPAIAQYADRYSLPYRVILFNGIEGENEPYTWEEFTEVVLGACMVLIWNGKHASTAQISEMCARKSIPCAFLEYGMLPQGHTLFVDPMGFNGKSLLHQPLNWIQSSDMDLLASTRKQLQEAYPLSDGDASLVPLQVFSDTQILYFCGYRSITQFGKHLLSAIPGELVFRRHPMCRGFEYGLPGTVDAQDCGPFLQHASRSKSVIGITSTCLFEAAVLGKPVMALGDHPLRVHADHDRVAAGALSLRVPRDDARIGFVLERHGIIPEGV